MASKTLMLLLLLAVVHCHCATSFAAAADEDDDGEYILDSPFSGPAVRKSRFLASAAKKIKKNSKCDARTHPHVCNGVYADKGASLLYCCKKHCRNVLGDRNNCGRCGRKCRLGERCCGGVCTNVAWNRKHCGTCNKRCGKGVRCEYGYCGYA